MLEPIHNVWRTVAYHRKQIPMVNYSPYIRFHYFYYGITGSNLKASWMSQLTSIAISHASTTHLACLILMATHLFLFTLLYSILYSCMISFCHNNNFYERRINKFSWQFIGTILSILGSFRRVLIIMLLIYCI